MGPRRAGVRPPRRDRPAPGEAEAIAAHGYHGERAARSPEHHHSIVCLEPALALDRVPAARMTHVGEGHVVVGAPRIGNTLPLQRGVAPRLVPVPATY